MKYSKTQFICCAILCIIFICIFFNWFTNQSDLEPLTYNQYTNSKDVSGIVSYVNDSHDTRTQLNEIHTKLLTYKVNSEPGTHSIDIQSKPGDKFNVSLSCDGIMVTYPTGPTGELGQIGNPGKPGIQGIQGIHGKPGIYGQGTTLNY
jgi:hypothetical protein